MSDELEKAYSERLEKGLTESFARFLKAIETEYPDYSEGFQGQWIVFRSSRLLEKAFRYAFTLGWLHSAIAVKELKDER